MPSRCHLDAISILSTGQIESEGHRSLAGYLEAWRRHSAGTGQTLGQSDTDGHGWHDIRIPTGKRYS